MSKNNNDTAVDIDVVADITNGIRTVAISEDKAAVAVCDMNSGEEDTISEKKCTSCEQNIEHTKTNDTEVNASATDMIVSICANCGKEGANNTCNKCKMVKYCNAACKKKHKSKHKSDCEEHLRRAAELQEEGLKRAAELHDIELFKQPPLSEEDCPICFVRLPTMGTGLRYKSCCGKEICSGCIHAPVYDNLGNAMDNEICPFCRIPTPETDEEIIKRIQKRVDAGGVEVSVEVDDAKAINHLGDFYYDGDYGLPRDIDKALELWTRAEELGSGSTRLVYFSIGNLYYFGDGVERDEEKAIQYFEKGAMGGCTGSRLALGYIEKNSGNMDRAIKHFMIAVRSGHNGGLKQIKQLYSQGHVSKEEYTKALRAYQKYMGEVKSSQRDEAAAASDEYKYLGGLL